MESEVSLTSTTCLNYIKIPIQSALFVQVISNIFSDYAFQNFARIIKRSLEHAYLPILKHLMAQYADEKIYLAITYAAVVNSEWTSIKGLGYKTDLISPSWKSPCILILRHVVEAIWMRGLIPSRWPREIERLLGLGGKSELVRAGLRCAR